MWREIVEILLLLSCRSECKPDGKSDPWQVKSDDVWLSKEFAKYETELRDLLQQPFFSRVNTKVRAKVGEAAFMPCRVKDLDTGNHFTVII